MSDRDNAVYIIAEVGSVHDGSFGNAGKLIELAAAVGADCVKFQTHIAAAETLRDAPMPPYFKGEPRFEYFERTGFTLEQWKILKTRADDCGLEFLSSPFSVAAVDLLEQIGISRYKIPSGEVSNIPMLEVVAATGKPVMLSSGMSDWREMDAAVETILKRHDRLMPMQCTTAYPCPDERIGLNVIGEMQRRWGLPVGYSDHSLDNHACFAAVALGAAAVEKHLTFSRAMYGSDAPHSAEPAQFAELVKGIRAISRMTASRIDKDDLVPYGAMRPIFTKSVVAAVDIPAGQPITRDMLTTKKPGDGIPAARLDSLVGRVTTRPVAADHKFTGEEFADGMPGG